MDWEDTIKALDSAEVDFPQRRLVIPLDKQARKTIHVLRDGKYIAMRFHGDGLPRPENKYLLHKAKDGLTVSREDDEDTCEVIWEGADKTQRAIYDRLMARLAKRERRDNQPEAMEF